MTVPPADPSSEPAGLAVVDKPPGMTSHDVVSRARRLLHTRKVGHAGTLDPMATGVLVLGVGRATRLLGHLALSDKTYLATIRLGAATTTDDAEGEVISTADASALSDDAVRSALAGFSGEIDQVPSSVSAVKVGGRRAHDRVRAGEEVELAARRVTIHELIVGEIRRTDGFVDVDIEVRCSSGTYVRAIARDLGAALGLGGHLTALRRAAVGPFTLDDAASLEDLTTEAVVPIADAARRFFPFVELDEAQARDVSHGRRLDVDLGASGSVAVIGPDGRFLALYEQAGDQAKAVAVFV